MLPSGLSNQALISLWSTLQAMESTLPARNNGLRYSLNENKQFDHSAMKIKSKEELYIEAYALAVKLDRTYCAILKQLGDRLGLYFANVRPNI